MKRSKSEYVIQTVTNALRVIEEFRQDEELGVTELSRRLDLHKNNVFRLLATLEEKGYVEQCPGGELYRLGVSCLEAADAFKNNRCLSRHGRTALERLARTTGESAHLGALSGHEVVHLDGEIPDRMVLSGLRRGRRLSAHNTALGKTLLAHTDAEGLECYDRDVVRAGLEVRTPATIADRDKLFDHLKSVASQGFALDLEEYEAGLCCASAPVRDAAGAVVGALSISGPSFRWSEADLLERAVPEVIATAARLSRDLGYRSA